MKRIIVIWLTISAIIAATEVTNATGEYICLDPGHGGSDPGALGPVYELPEQWVNLQVALECSTLLDEMGQWYNIRMTRTDETTDVPLWDRVNKANYEGLHGGPVDAFVSIHHNSYPPYPGTQGTEVWWSSIPETDSAYDRAYADSTLGMKTQFRILNKWGYNDRCAYARAPIGTPTCNGEYCCNHCCVRYGTYPDYTWDCCWEPWFPDSSREKLYFVLRNTMSPAALSEASNLKDTLEELWFQMGDIHINQEADAINWAIFSYLTNEGIAIVRNSYSGGIGGEVIVSKYEDYECYDTDTVASPYTTCWTRWEAYCLEAITPQWIDGYQRTFHHWAHLNFLDQPAEIFYDPFWIISVELFEDYHKYVAYFFGGPYSAEVVSPDGGQNWHPDEQRDIVWNASVGADSTTLINIFLDRNGGNGGYPDHLLTDWPAKWGNSFTWTVTGPYSAHCRIKVVAEDVAGNSDEDVSDHDFSISDTGNNNPVIDTGLHCKYAQTECNECINWGESFWLEVHAHDPDADSMYYEWHCGPPPFGGHFSNGQNVMTTAQNYVVYTAPTTGKQGEDYLSVAVTDVRGGQT